MSRRGDVEQQYTGPRDIQASTFFKCVLMCVFMGMKGDLYVLLTISYSSYHFRWRDSAVDVVVA